MKKMTFFFAFTLAVLIGFGQSVSINTAKKAAKNHYLKHSNAAIKRRITDISFSGEYVVKNIADTLYYVFNIDNNKGFVIISADQRAHPIIGYSFSGAYSSTDQPPAFTEWLEHRKQELIYIKSGNLPSSNLVTREWDALNSVTPAPDTPTLGPLLQTTWSQDCYYNYMCPADTAGPCGNTVTGCVATSMAQIMRYWSFPTLGRGTHSYSHQIYGQLSANFGATRYNWSEMPNQLIMDNQYVAMLMFHCGVSVEMNYGPRGSSAQGPLLALINSFNYSPKACFLERSNYLDTAWEDIIKAEIDLSQPVWYRGDSTGGHAFVCDGYQNTNYFHFNWGWSGYFDGYFYLSALNPGTYNYTNNQWAIINIRPSSYITTNLKVFIEGALNSGTGLMNASTEAVIPISQPYNAAPWNYTGNESVESVPTGVVDWVLIELRQATAPNLATSSTILSMHAAFLKTNGTIVDIDGESPVSFFNTSISEGNNLYVVIRHRNHLAVMSANSATLNAGTYSYDFTTGLSQAYGGGSGCKQLGSTIVMVSGDMDKDGNIFVSDFNNWAVDFGATNGYFTSDFDMDGNVWVSDYNKWAVNFGFQTDTNLKSTQINSEQIKPKYSSMVPK
jgi:hypothetical protein